MSARSKMDAFSGRDWSIIGRLDADHWARAFERSGPGESIRASRALWVHMKRVRPDWPSEEDRRRDVEHHVAFKALLMRAADVADR